MPWRRSAAVGLGDGAVWRLFVLGLIIDALAPTFGGRRNPIRR
jgi:hypothetical protein